MFLLKSLSLCCLGNSADFHTAERGAAQNLSAWFAPREARTPSCRPGGNLRGHSPVVSLQTSNHKNPMTDAFLTPTPLCSFSTDLLHLLSDRREWLLGWSILLWTMADRSTGTDGVNAGQKLKFQQRWMTRGACQDCLLLQNMSKYFISFYYKHSQQIRQAKRKAIRTWQRRKKHPKQWAVLIKIKYGSFQHHQHFFFFLKASEQIHNTSVLI